MNKKMFCKNFRQNMKMRKTIRELNKLDDKQLEDIGFFPRSEIPNILKGLV